MAWALQVIFIDWSCLENFLLKLLAVLRVNSTIKMVKLFAQVALPLGLNELFKFYFLGRHRHAM